MFSYLLQQCRLTPDGIERLPHSGASTIVGHDLQDAILRTIVGLGHQGHPAGVLCIPGFCNILRVAGSDWLPEWGPAISWN